MNKQDLELNWSTANAWETLHNTQKEKYREPTWRWDCNFKLDFDGPIVRISSRFYPPHKNAGDWWEGTATVMIMDDEIFEKRFKADTLELLRIEVENFKEDYTATIKAKLSNPELLQSQ